MYFYARSNQMKKKSILFIITILIISCNNSKKTKNFFSPLYGVNSSNISSNYISGSYSEDSILVTFKTESDLKLKLIYNLDTITGSNEITYHLKKLIPKLINIPTAIEDYSKYVNNWKAPIGEFSSFHQIKVLALKNNIIVDSSIYNYLLGLKSELKFAIVNLKVDSKTLFDDEEGCYVPGNSFNREKDQTSGNFYKFKKRKQTGKIEIFNKNEIFLKGSFPFRIHGYVTPLAPQKSLRFYIHQKNNVNTLLELDHQVDKIILRSSFSGWGNEIFVDGWISKICKNLNVDVMSYQPVLVYLNGEYWGIHGLRERMDLKAISNKYKTKEKNLIDADDKGYSKKEGYGDLNSLLQEIKKNPKTNYEKIAKKFNMSSIVDWFIIELFFQNNDWPCNNTFFWKKRRGNKPWNAVLIDMDACVGNPEFNMFDYVQRDWSPALGGELINYLLKQSEFEMLFTKRVNYLLENELSSENLMANLIEFKKSFSPMVEEHYSRWGYKNGTKKYKKGLSVLEKFCVDRPENFKKNMNQYFKNISNL